MNTTIESPWAAIERWRQPPAPPSVKVKAPRPATSLANLIPHAGNGMKAGDRIGEWTLRKYVPGTRAQGEKRREAKWICVCSCGIVRAVRVGNLSRRSSVSCGHVQTYGRGEKVPLSL